MQLQIKPSKTNTYPLDAILIKGLSITDWLNEMEWMNVQLHNCNVYPLPGNIPNSVWGCLVILPKMHPKIDIGRNQYFQNIYDRLYIPERTVLFPKMSEAEIEKMFATPYFMHPEIGLVALEGAIQWEDYLFISEAENTKITTPKESVFIPKSIKRVEVFAPPAENVLEKLEKESFPEKESFKDNPLSFAEKIKLQILRFLFPKSKGNDFSNNGDSSRGISKFIKNIIPKLPLKGLDKWLGNLSQMHQNLEQRNLDETQKLLDLLKKNPEEALKYAIPLDAEGISRGDKIKANLSMIKRWSSFLTSSSQLNNNSNGSYVLEDDSYQQLSRQYHDTALDLIKKRDYSKAAFVYLKLLKNAHLAASTLEEGKQYADAAAIHLTYNKNKTKAAGCYEKGNMISNAIDIYKELSQHEKVGDLYTRIGQFNDAEKYYNIVADEHRSNLRYVKASLLYRNKMNNTESAQSLLLKGWRENTDAFNCLNNYFANINDAEKVEQINQVYQNDTSNANKESFLNVLKYEHKKHPEIQNRTREIAYEIVSELSENNSLDLTMLNDFNDDKHLTKDILRYKNRLLKR